MSVVAKIPFVDYRSSVSKALELIEAEAALPQNGLIILKPNLTNASQPPVTTHVEAVEAVYEWCSARTDAEIAIGEGCGSGDTMDYFRATGYTALAARHGLRLIDFNTCPTVCVSHPEARQLREFHMPEVLREAFVISIPVLKDHSMVGATVSMKNMFGIAPESHYGGSWNKSKLHSPSTDRSVMELCLYKKPGISVVDASVVLTGMHLCGTPKRLDLILASVDPVALDTVASQLLGHDPMSIHYLILSDGVLGTMHNFEVLDG